MRFLLLVEGITERACAPAFIKKWLDPQLTQPVGIQTIAFDGAGEFANEVVKTARAYLDGPSESEIVAVIGLLDLYGPTFYPAHLTSADERHEWATKHFERLVGRQERFRMYFAVHEFEAWVLSQPDVFPSSLRGSVAKFAARPEAINFNEPPCKLIERFWISKTGKSYKKSTDGAKLFAKLDPEIAAKKCPRLKSMLETMLAMARAAGL